MRDFLKNRFDTTTRKNPFAPLAIIVGVLGNRLKIRVLPIEKKESTTKILLKK